MDVLDVGPRLLQEFDVLLQRVGRKEITFKEASMIAGDETTRQMRQFRQTVTDICQSMTGSHDRPLMCVGGDEAILAMDSTHVNDALLLALREKTGSRVVKSVVGLSERSSQNMSSLQVKQEHLAAQQRAEQGVDRAKNIERALHAVRLDTQCLPQYLQKTYESRIQKLHLNNYAVAQQEQDSVLIRKDAGAISCDAIEGELHAIQKDMEEQFRKEMNRLQQKGYGGVNEQNIKLLIKLQREFIQGLGNEKGEEVFEKLLEPYKT